MGKNMIIIAIGLGVVPIGFLIGGDDSAGFCKQSHPRYNGLHPVCRVCGHCALRGSHSDDISDLQ